MKNFCIALLALLLAPAAFAQDTSPAVSVGGPVGITGGLSREGQNLLTHMTDANYTMIPGGWWAGTQIVPSSLTLTAARTITAPSNPGQPYLFCNFSTGGFATPVWSGSGTPISVPNGGCVLMHYLGTTGTYVQDPGSTGSASGFTLGSGYTVATVPVYFSAESSRGTCTTALTVASLNGNHQSVTLTNADTCALTFTQPSTGTANITLKVVQSATTPFSGAISGGAVNWIGGAVPTIPATASAVVFLSCYLDGTSTFCAATSNSGTINFAATGFCLAMYPTAGTTIGASQICTDSSGDLTVPGAVNGASIKYDPTRQNTYLGTTLPAPTGGLGNTAIGQSSGTGLTTGSSNTLLGAFTNTITSGTGNTVVGLSGGSQIVAGSDNTVIGYDADSVGSDTTDTIAIGYLARPTASHQTVIGHSTTTSLLMYGCPTGQVALDDGSGTCFTPGGSTAGVNAATVPMINSLQVMANSTISQDLNFFTSDGTPYWAAGPAYAGAGIFLEDYTYSLIQNPGAFQGQFGSPAIRNIVAKTIAVADTNGQLPPALGVSGTAAGLIYSGFDVNHAYYSGVTMYMLPLDCYQDYKLTGQTTCYTNSVVAIKKAQAYAPINGTSHLPTNVVGASEWVPQSLFLEEAKVSGDVASASVLRAASDAVMFQMATAAGDSTNAAIFSTDFTNVTASIQSEFIDPTTSMLIAATGQNNQLDILTSGMAVWFSQYTGQNILTLSQQKAIGTFLHTHLGAMTHNGYFANTVNSSGTPIVWATQGIIPSGGGGSGYTATGCSTGSYQNGYWSLGVGMYAYALSLTNPSDIPGLLASFRDAATGSVNDPGIEYYTQAFTFASGGLCGTATTPNMESPQGAAWANANLVGATPLAAGLAATNKYGALVSPGSNTYLSSTGGTINGVLHLTNGSGGTTGLNVGSGTFFNLSSDAYLMISSSSSFGAGAFINRNSTALPASVDLASGATTNSGWSMQMAAGSIDWTLLDRVNSQPSIDCQAGIANPCTFDKPIAAAKINVAAGRKGTFVCTVGGPITIANTNELVTSDVAISLNTAGGTISTSPAMKTVTSGTGFTVLCGAADTSTYNYDILN